MSTNSLPQRMKAVQIKEFNTPYYVSEVDVPTPKPHQVLVQIKAGGFCHTDCMVLENAFNSTLPVIGSHEPAGVVVDVGSGVKGFQKGDRVGCLNFESCCGECPDCRAGKPLYCDRPLMKGITTDGAWAEYMVADAQFVVKLPDSMNFPVAACLMCAGTTIYASIKAAQVPVGGSIAIIGIGGLGHIGTQLAKAMGYKVVAVDVKQNALELVGSYKWKADLGILATEPVDKAVEAISNEIGGHYPGVDASILATDALPSFKFAAGITRKHGTMVLLGQPEKGITLSFHDVIFRDLKLVGSLLGTTEDAQELVHIVADQGINLEIKEWSMERVEDMRQEYLTGSGIGKNVLVM